MSYEKPTRDERIARTAMTNAKMHVSGEGLRMQHDDMVAMIVEAIEKSRGAEHETLQALRNWPYVAVEFDSGTTFALTGENTGHWVEGSPTHQPIPDEGLRYPLKPSRAWVENGKVFIEAQVPEIIHLQVNANRLGEFSLMHPDDESVELSPNQRKRYNTPDVFDDDPAPPGDPRFRGPGSL